VHPPTHALIGWGVANLAPSLDRRSRAIVFFASVIPDLDGLTFFSTELYQRWHRTLCHNAVFAAVCVAAAALLAPAGRRATVAALVAVNFHLHLLCDYLGSAGPDGSIWGIPYFEPFSDLHLDNPWQWGLRSWQNAVITIAALAWAVHIARRYGRSPVEPFSRRGDAAVVEAVRRRLG
jgi:inner membrane protein